MDRSRDSRLYCGTLQANGRVKKRAFPTIKRRKKSTEAENARKEIDTEVEAWKEKWYKEIE